MNQHWVEILTVFGMGMGLLVFMVLPSHEADRYVPRGELRYDMPFAARSVGEGEFKVFRRARPALSPDIKRVMQFFEANWQGMSGKAELPGTLRKRDMFLILDEQYAQGGDYLTYAEILETLHLQGRILKRMQRIFPAPAARALDVHVKNLADLQPWVARARWHLGSIPGALAVAEQAVMELPENADGFMMLALLRGQMNPQTRMEFLALRNLFRRIVQLEPGFNDPVLQLDAGKIHQIIDSIEQQLNGFDIDPVPVARAASQKAWLASLEVLARIEKLVVVIERLRRRYLVWDRAEGLDPAIVPGEPKDPNVVPGVDPIEEPVAP